MGNSNRKRLSWAVELLVHKAVYICRSDVQLPYNRPSVYVGKLLYVTVRGR